MTMPSQKMLPGATGFAGASGLSTLIYETLDRFLVEWHPGQMPAKLVFPAELEGLFESQTRVSRVRELRFTVSAAIGFMCVTTVTDPALVPDMGWAGLQLRLVAGAVLGCAVRLFGRVSGRAREILAFWAGYFAVIVIIAVPCLSRAVTAPYGMFISFLAFIYANTTFPMRFQDAWRFNLLALATITTFMHFNPVIGGGLEGAMMFMGVVASSYTLIANYRMERSARVGFLLAAKEALRLQALHRDRDQLAAISNTDGLTGVANRRAFDDRLLDLFANEEQNGLQVHLILIDVDFFKRFNDHYGHLAGDGCLRSIAQLLANGTREETDLAFRFGGEEFGALLVSPAGARVEETAERVRHAIESEGIEHLNRDDGLRVVTVSAGVATVTLGAGGSAEALIEMADQALYRAKEMGRNRVCVGQGTMALAGCLEEQQVPLR